MSRPYQRAKSNTFLVLWIVLAGLAGMGIWYGVLRYSATLETTPKLIESLGTAGLSLAFGAVLGGLIKLLFDAWTDRRAARASDLAFYDQLMMDFKFVYNTVERARFLIAAHQSAKTYGEQMRALPDAIIVLHNVRRATRQGFPDLYDELNIPIRCCIFSLKCLTTEFRQRYLQVSRLQSQDEENNKQRRAAIASGALPQDVPTHSARAWSRISTFEALAPLLRATRDEGLERDEAAAAFAPYRRAFVRHIDLASYCLARRMPNAGAVTDPRMEALRQACLAIVAAENGRPKRRGLLRLFARTRVRSLGRRRYTS